MRERTAGYAFERPVGRGGMASGTDMTWQARPRGAGASGGEPLILVGLDAICRAVGAGQTAVKRWIRDEGFPARRCTDGTYRADPESVRRWFGA